MADTTNFAWTKPIVDGSSGAWGQILNDALDAIDTDLKAVKDDADAASTYMLHFPILWASMHATADAAFGGDTAYFDLRTKDVDGMSLNISDGTLTTVKAMIPIHGLGPGMALTGFKSRGIAPSGTTLTVEILLKSESGQNISVIGQQTHGTSEATLTQSGASGETSGSGQYFFRVTMTRTTTSITPTLKWVQPLVEAV